MPASSRGPRPPGPARTARAAVRRSRGRSARRPSVRGSCMARAAAISSSASRAASSNSPTRAAARAAPGRHGKNAGFWTPTATASAPASRHVASAAALSLRTSSTAARAPSSATRERGAAIARLLVGGQVLERRLGRGEVALFEQAAHAHPDRARDERAPAHGPRGERPVDLGAARRRRRRAPASGAPARSPRWRARARRPRGSRRRRPCRARRRARPTPRCRRGAAVTAQIAGSSTPPWSSIAPSPQARRARAVAAVAVVAGEHLEAGEVGEQVALGPRRGSRVADDEPLDPLPDLRCRRAVPQRRGRPSGLQREVQRRRAGADLGQRPVEGRGRLDEGAARVEEVAELVRERRPAFGICRRGCRSPRAGGRRRRARRRPPRPARARRGPRRARPARAAPRARGAGTAPPGAAPRGAAPRRRRRAGRSRPRGRPGPP